MIFDGVLFHFFLLSIDRVKTSISGWRLAFFRHTFVSKVWTLSFSCLIVDFVWPVDFCAWPTEELFHDIYHDNVGNCWPTSLHFLTVRFQYMFDGFIFPRCCVFVVWICRFHDLLTTCPQRSLDFSIDVKGSGFCMPAFMIFQDISCRVH